jgi:hypothetical protein
MYGLLDMGHYLYLTTNTTIQSQIKKIVAFPMDFRERIFFKISLHYQEMKRLNMLDVFVENINMLKQSGIGYGLEIVESDYLLDDIEEIKSFCLGKFGALPHVLVGRDEEVLGSGYQDKSSCLHEDEHKRVWESFDSDLFKYQKWANKVSHQKNFNYCGVYIGTLHLDTGNFFCCPITNKTTNLFEDIEKPIRFVPTARACPFDFCYCGFFWHVIGGADRDFDPGVYFHQFRDRVCTDGSTWLTPTIREIFSHRSSEYHEPYSKEKQEFFDALMQKVYFDDEGKNDNMVNFIKAYCNRKRFEKVAICGMGKIGAWLLPLFIKAGVEVEYAIDKRACELGDACGLPVITPDDKPEDVDAIIVSVYSEYTAIAPHLRERTNIPIISIVDFAEDL